MITKDPSKTFKKTKTQSVLRGSQFLRTWQKDFMQCHCEEITQLNSIYAIHGSDSNQGSETLHFCFLSDFYHPKKKLRKGDVFTPVYQSFCSQGSRWVPAPVHAGTHPHWAGTPPAQTPPRADTLPHPQQTATAADGTHPTGMHTC